MIGASTTTQITYNKPLLMKSTIKRYKVFHSLYKEYRDKIYTYIYYRVGNNKEIAEDITADVFLAIYENIDSYDPSKGTSAWVYRVAKNKVIDYYRVHKQDLALDEVEVSLEHDFADLLDTYFELEKIEQHFNALSELQQICIKEKYLLQKSTKEISQRYNISNESVRQHVSRGLKILRESLQVLLVFFPLFL